jgi:hypothetical protein
MGKKSEINILERQRLDLLRSITDIYPIIPGSFKEVFRKCGKPNCWCHSSATGHPLKRIAWKERGASKTKVIAEDDIEWVLGATENYRRYRMMIASLQQIEVRLHEMLKDHGNEMIEKTRRAKKL